MENVARKRNVKKDAGVVRNSLLRPPDFSFLILHFFFHLCSNFKELNKGNEMGDWLVLKVATVNLIISGPRADFSMKRPLFVSFLRAFELTQKSQFLPKFCLAPP